MFFPHPCTESFWTSSPPLFSVTVYKRNQTNETQTKPIPKYRTRGRLGAPATPANTAGVSVYRAVSGASWCFQACPCKINPPRLRRLCRKGRLQKSRMGREKRDCAGHRPLSAAEVASPQKTLSSEVHFWATALPAAFVVGAPSRCHTGRGARRIRRAPPEFLWWGRVPCHPGGGSGYHATEVPCSPLEFLCNWAHVW